MESIPIRLCHSENDMDSSTEEVDDNENTATAGDIDKATMIKATTRSVFGWKRELVFNPRTDVEVYAGSRPFANFIAKGVTLYAHPEMLNEDMRALLFVPKAPEERKASDDDDEIF